MPPGDRELDAAYDDRAPSAVGAHLVDVGERDQQGPVDPPEPGRAPLLLQRRERDPHQVGLAAVGVEAGVVALRLHVRDVAAVDEPGHAGPLDRDLGVVGRRAAVAAGHDPAHRLGEPLGPHRLEHVVDRVQVERVDGVLFVGGHEHHRRRLLEPAEHLRELQAAQPGHLHVEEHRVDVGLPQRAQAVGRGAAGDDLADPVVGAEQEAELVERRLLVVDDQHPQPSGVPCRHPALTPGANLGTRTTTLVPAPRAVSTTRP